MKPFVLISGSVSQWQFSIVERRSVLSNCLWNSLSLYWPEYLSIVVLYWISASTSMDYPHFPKICICINNACNTRTHKCLGYSSNIRICSLRMRMWGYFQHTDRLIKHSGYFRKFLYSEHLLKENMLLYVNEWYLLLYYWTGIPNKITTIKLSVCVIYRHGNKWKCTHIYIHIHRHLTSIQT